MTLPSQAERPQTKPTVATQRFQSASPLEMRENALSLFLGPGVSVRASPRQRLAPEPRPNSCSYGPRTLLCIEFDGFLFWGVFGCTLQFVGSYFPSQELNLGL